MEFKKAYWLKNHQLNKQTSSIDDLTWNDLDMDLLYTKLNATQSSCGSEVLYSKLRELSFDNTSITNFYQLIPFFQNNTKLKANCLIALYNLGDQDSLRLFDFLFTKERIEKINVLPFYLLCSSQGK
ncbi:MAG: hypothetical protein ACK5LC_14230 [Coprobacillaceae bacterium]